MESLEPAYAGAARTSITARASRKARIART
jgi:hypothetical protein